MTKSELTKDMKAAVGSGFITRRELAAYMGYKDPGKIDKYIRDLQKVGKRYFIPDVADALCRCIDY